MELFDKNERFTNQALDIDREFCQALKPIFLKYTRQGASIRQLAYIASSSLAETHLDLLLDDPKIVRGSSVE